MPLVEFGLTPETNGSWPHQANLFASIECLMAYKSVEPDAIELHPGSVIFTFTQEETARKAAKTLDREAIYGKGFTLTDPQLYGFSMAELQ